MRTDLKAFLRAAGLSLVLGGALACGPKHKAQDSAILPPGVATATATGSVVLPTGFSLPTSSLKVGTFLGTFPVATDGQFTALEPGGGGPATVMLTASSGKIVMLGHVDTANAAFNAVSPASTAEELLFLSTGATGLPQSEWPNVYRLLAAAPETATLAGVITTRMAANPTAVDDQDPEILAAVDAATASLLSPPPAAAARTMPRGNGLQATIQVAPATASSPVVSVQTTPSGTTPDPEYGVLVAASEDNTGIVLTNSARINRYYYVYRTGVVPEEGKTTDPATAISPWVLVKAGFLPAVNGSTGVANTLIDYFSGKGIWKAETSGTIPLPPTPAGVKANTYQVFVVGMGAHMIDTPADLMANGDSAEVVNMMHSMAVYQGLKEIVWPIMTKILPANPSTANIWGDPSKAVAIANQFFKEAGTAGASYSSQLLNGGDLWPSTMTFFKASVANPQFRDAAYRLICAVLWEGAEMVPAAQAPLVVFDQFASKLFAIIKPIDAVLTVGDQVGMFYQVVQSNTINIWTVRAMAPTLTMSPTSATVGTLGQTAIFSVTTTGYASSTLTYLWDAGAYGLFSDGVEKKNLLLSQGHNAATYSLSGTSFPTAKSDIVSVQVWDGGNLLGTVKATVKFEPLTGQGLVVTTTEGLTFCGIPEPGVTIQDEIPTGIWCAIYPTPGMATPPGPHPWVYGLEVRFGNFYLHLGTGPLSSGTTWDPLLPGAVFTVPINAAYSPIVVGNFRFICHYADNLGTLTITNLELVGNGVQLATFTFSEASQSPFSTRTYSGYGKFYVPPLPGH